MLNILAVFVYGSLKRGYLRGDRWPTAPLSIQPARIQASLYDVGPYPAIGEGNDWILGELRTIAERDIDETLRVLDQIEGYDALGVDNEYVRVPTTAILENGESRQAYVYRFAAVDRLKNLRSIKPFQPFAGELCAAWPDSLARVPKSFADE